MDNISNASYITLESLALQKAELLKQLRDQKELMTDTARSLFAPPEPATNKSMSLMRAFNTGMAVFDGVKLGLKVIKQFRRMFGSRKK